jgi:type I restriction enzyme S subunit
MWKTIKLGDVCLVTDYVANGSFQSLRENVKYLDGDGFAILVRLTDFTKGWNGNYKYVSEDAYNFLSKSTVYAGDLVISNVGEPGKTFLVPDLGHPMTLAPNSILVRPKDEILLTDYLKYFIDSSYGQNLIRTIESGTTQRKFNKTSFRALEIPIPPLAEQQRIVAKLDAAFAEIDKAINAVDAKTSQSEHLKAVVLAALLKGSTVKIGDVCELATGGTPSRKKKEYFENGNIKWLVSGDINQKVIHDCEGRITDEGLANSNAKYLPENSVLIALNGQGKTRGTVALLRTKATCNQSLVSISPKTDVDLDTRFLFYVLDGMYRKIRRMTGDSGNDRRGLNMPLISTIEIPLPPFAEQQRIVDKLDVAYAQIETIASSMSATKENYSALKSAILAQELQPPQSEAA